MKRVEENEKLVNKMRAKLKNEIDTLERDSKKLMENNEFLEEKTGETYIAINSMMNYCTGQTDKIQAKLSQMDEGAEKVLTWREKLFKY